MNPTQFSEVRTRVAAANARARAAAEPAIRAVLAAELPPEESYAEGWLIHVEAEYAA